MKFLHLPPDPESPNSAASKGEYRLLAGPTVERRTTTTTMFLLWSFTVCNVLLFAYSLFLLNLTHELASNDGRYTTTLNGDLKKVSSYSPIFDLIDLHPQPTLFNGAVHDNASIFRADPSPEVDAAWDLLSAEGFEITTVPSSALRYSHKEPSMAVQAPGSWNRGADAYVVQIDAFHQVHCLNELRKQIFFDYYYRARYPAGVPVPEEHMVHKKHCLHVLLQNIMCHADVDVIPHYWVHYRGMEKEQPGRPWAEPLADFNTVKQCRDFAGLLEWARRDAVKELGVRWRELRYPQGQGKEVVDGGEGYFLEHHEDT